MAIARDESIGNNMIHWNPKQETIDRYLAVCKAAVESDEVFDTFKRNPDYTTILEHTSKELGEQYAKWVFPGLKKYNSNDNIGAPILEKISGVTCSPTTMQYLAIASKVAMARLRQFNPNNIIGNDIIEIGGGYGGQCKIFHDMINVRSYTIIDLPEVIALQRKYLSIFGLHPNLFTPDNYPKHEKYNFVISNYALSEVKEPLQEQYIRDICLNSKHGYITCNAPLNSVHLLKEKFSTYKKSPDIDGERKENFIITW